MIDPNDIIKDKNEKDMETAFTALHNIYNWLIKGGFSRWRAAQIIAVYLMQMGEK